MSAGPLSTERASNVEGARVIPMIVIDSVVGAGTEESPRRVIREVYSVEGHFIARRDPWIESVAAGGTMPGPMPPGSES